MFPPPIVHTVCTIALVLLYYLTVTFSQNRNLFCVILSGGAVDIVLTDNKKVSIKNKDSWMRFLGYLFLVGNTFITVSFPRVESTLSPSLGTLHSNTEALYIQ